MVAPGGTILEFLTALIAIKKPILILFFVEDFLD